MAEETDNPSVEELEAKYKELLATKISQMEEAMNASQSEESTTEESESDKPDETSVSNSITKEDLAEFKASLMNDIKEDLMKDVDGETNDDTETGLGNSKEGDTMNSTQKPKEFSFYASRVYGAAKQADIDIEQNYVPHYNESTLKAYVQNGIESFSATDADDGCEDDTSAWQNEDYFVDDIWFELICQSDFLGKVGHRKYTHPMGAGGQVQIKMISIESPAHDWGDSASLDPCECMSCVSNSFTTYTVSIKKYGDMKEICNADKILAGSEIEGAILQSMKIRLSERIDNEIWTNLAAASGSYSVTLDAECSNASRGTDGDCCTYSVNLFDDVIDLHDEMWNAGYFRTKGAVLIANKTLTSLLKYKDGLSPQIKNALQYKGTSLVAIGDIKVIESCHAPTCASSSTGDTVAVLIDPDRAFAEVWAQKPKYEKDRNIDCDSVTATVWAYGAFDTLDTDAVGAINNP